MYAFLGCTIAAGDEGQDEREYMGGEGVDEVDEERESDDDDDDDDEEEEEEDDELGDNALVLAEEALSSATGESDARAPSSDGDIGQEASLLFDVFLPLGVSRCPLLA